jgi:hypothetical protein
MDSIERALSDLREQMGDVSGQEYEYLAGFRAGLSASQYYTDRENGLRGYRSYRFISDDSEHYRGYCDGFYAQKEV